MVSDETRAVLLAAADLIEPEGAWCKIYSARDAKGKSVRASSSKACSWCILGSITRAQAASHSSQWGKTIAAVTVVLGNRSIAEWNDAPERTQAEVVAALRAAAGAA